MKRPMEEDYVHFPDGFQQPYYEGFIMDVNKYIDHIEKEKEQLIELLEGFTEGMRRYWKDTYQEETPDLAQVIEAEELINKLKEQ